MPTHREPIWCVPAYAMKPGMIHVRNKEPHGLARDAQLAPRCARVGTTDDDVADWVEEMRYVGLIERLRHEPNDVLLAKRRRWLRQELSKQAVAGGVHESRL